MREYETVVGSTLRIQPDKLSEAFEILKKERANEEDGQIYEDMLTLLKDRFEWEGVIQADGALAYLCPIEKERVSHEDWNNLLHLLTPFLLNGTSIEFFDNDEGTLLRILIDKAQIRLQRQVITMSWRDC